MRFTVIGVSGVIALALGTTSMAGQARAGALSASDILGQFNAVVTNDFTSSSDVEGRLVVGGNMTGGATFYNNPFPIIKSDYGAVNVYGSVAPGNYNVNNSGNVNVAGTNSGRFNLNGGTYSSSIPGGGSFDSSFGATLSTLSTQLGGMSANNVLPTTTDMNNVQITAKNVDSSGIAVFKITAAQLSQYASFNVNLGSAKTVVFDVMGNYNQQANFQNFTDRTVDSHVIWNFTDATSVSLQGFGGTVLAGSATVTNSSPINGSLYALNYSGNGELHNRAFAGVLADPAPLPPLGSSLGGLLVIAGFVSLRMKHRVRAVVGRITGFGKGTVAG
jgi:choice-of-anchor A domain-containing protein